jgi:hypothetical protein
MVKILAAAFIRYAMAFALSAHVGPQDPSRPRRSPELSSKSTAHSRKVTEDDAAERFSAAEGVIHLIWFNHHRIASA